MDTPKYHGKHCGSSCKTIRLAISESGGCRQKKLGEVIDTYQHVNNNNIVNIVYLVKQPQAIHYYGDIDGHATD